jgi:hypothetical protein
MRVASRLAAIAALSLAFTGTAEAGFSVEFAKGPDPAVARWPSWPYPVACQSAVFDPVPIFGGPTDAENGSGGPELALRRYLDEGLYAQLPTRFWRLISSSPTHAAFASGRLELGLFVLGFDLVGGQWQHSGAPEECRARTIRDGNMAIRWDPAEHPKPGAKQIRVWLSGGRCGGHTGGDNAAAEPPEVRRVGGRLVITIWQEPLRPPPPAGVLGCKKKREGPLIVRLPGRLGRRQLWDGSTYPPRRVL